MNVLIIWLGKTSRKSTTAARRKCAQKTLQKVDLIRELGEPYSAQIFVGTPTSQGDGSEEDPGDLYTALLAREKERRESGEPPQMLFTIDPCWTVKPGVGKLPYDPTLTPDEVDLLFPAHLTFKVLYKELKENVRNFRQQHLCSWLPPEDEGIKIQFDPDLLASAIVSKSAVPQGETVLSVDVAYSLNAKADLTSVAAVRIYDNAAGEKCMCVLDIEADRMRGSELATKLVMITRQYQSQGLRNVLIEKGPTADNLRTQIQMAGAKSECQVPVYFVPPTNVKNAKILRIKDLQYLLEQGRLKFASGAYLDALFAELQRLDGTKSNASKKDDRADAIAQVAQVYRIWTAEAKKSKTKRRDGARIGQPCETRQLLRRASRPHVRRRRKPLDNGPSV